MSDELTSSNFNNKDDGESDKPISEEEGFKSAESMFKSETNKSEDLSLDEDKEFLKYLKFRKKAKDLGLDDPRFATYYQGGVHFANSTVENHGSVVGNDQAVYSASSTGGFSGGNNDGKSPVKGNPDSIESIFDKCEDIKQRSFMISLSALNGCNYRTVIEASQKLQSILQFQVEADIEA